ncbi:MAG: hypothetical protein U0790_07240 [Isosphaeraceae bacterium]
MGRKNSWSGRLAVISARSVALSRDRRGDQPRLDVAVKTEGFTVYIANLETPQQDH